MSVFDVANTIFPHESHRWRDTPDTFVGWYRQAYDRLPRRPGGWGTYFQRLTEPGGDGGDQLRRTVSGLRSWGHAHHGAFVVHYQSSEHRPRPLGAPCLQYVQFMADADRLSMTAVYRSHDYFAKALGNLVGLARLLKYICQKTNHTVGTLTCISTYAFLNCRRDAASLLGGPR